MEAEGLAINEGNVKLSYKEIGKKVDSIPNFSTSLSEMFSHKGGEGHIPKLGHWFWPLSENGTEDEAAIYDIRSKADYRKWEPRKVIDKDRLEWREKYHSVAYFLDPEARKIIDDWGDDLNEKFKILREANIDNNLVRLLTHEHAPACRDFAIACMKYVPEMSDGEIHRLFPSIGGDGDAGAQFWTIAPYIMDALKTSRFEKGIKENDEEDFLRVMLWSKRRIKTGEWGNDAIYPGVGHFRDRIIDFYLPRDGFHPIHKFIGKVGEHIASYLEKIPVDKEMIKNKERVRFKRED